MRLYLFPFRTDIVIVGILKAAPRRVVAHSCSEGKLTSQAIDHNWGGRPPLSMCKSLSLIAPLA